MLRSSEGFPKNMKGILKSVLYNVKQQHAGSTKSVFSFQLNDHIKRMPSYRTHCTCGWKLC
jgi:hypothetical protein